MVSKDTQLDATDWRILELLQTDARLPFAEIARRVNMSSTAVAERVRRMEDIGIIQGYAIKLNYERLGWPITAYIRLMPEGKAAAPDKVASFAEKLPEIQELYSTVDTDCYLFKVVVRSVSHLDDILSKLRPYGKTATSIVLAALIDGQMLNDGA